MRRMVAVLWVGWLAQAGAGEPVRVGGAAFPPYIEATAEGGLRIELLELLNQVQNQYEFRVVASNPSRRHQDFDRKLYDYSFFDQPDWGWQGRQVEHGDVIATGAERYIAMVRDGRDQRYFDDFAGKRMIGMRGYHYGFAGFNSDPDFLKREFNFVGTTNNEASIRQLLAGRGDVALVTDAYLADYLIRHPQLKPRLLISDKADQRYRLTIIARKGVRPSVDEIEKMITTLRERGMLQPLWKRYGITP
ncbi:hypothetical protein ACTSKR_00060 [Chitinibacteraceae bacterium HSL-7]